MSEETRNFDLSAEVAYALAVLPSAHSAIMRVYNRDRAKYYALARQSDKRNHPALFCGRAEHQIMAQRVLGILSSGEVENLCMIFRSVNRRMYDELIQHKGSEERILLDPFLRHIPSTASALYFYDIIGDHLKIKNNLQYSYLKVLMFVSYLFNALLHYVISFI